MARGAPLLAHGRCACCALAAGPHAARPQLARQLLLACLASRRTPAGLLLARAATRSSQSSSAVLLGFARRCSVVRLIQFGGSPKPKPKPTTEIAKSQNRRQTEPKTDISVRFGFGSVIGFR